MATRYAQIVNGLVHWIFDDASLYASYQETAAELGLTFLEITDDSVQEGWSYDGSAFAAPVIPSPTLAPISLEPIDFKRLFAPAEYVALKASTDANVQFFLYLLDTPSVTRVVLSDALVTNGVNYCASQSLITADRAVRILSGQSPV